MDAVVAAAVSLVLAAAGGQVSASIRKTMNPEVKRTVIVLFGVAAAFYFAFILMSVLSAT